MSTRLLLILRYLAFGTDEDSIGFQHTLFLSINPALTKISRDVPNHVVQGPAVPHDFGANVRRWSVDVPAFAARN